MFGHNYIHTHDVVHCGSNFYSLCNALALSTQSDVLADLSSKNVPSLP